MTRSPDTTPRFQWRYRQDGGWTWSSSHTIEGPCFGCCPRDALGACPRCGGRSHRDLAIIDDRVSGAMFCQQERTDGLGRRTRMRSAESEAELAGRIAEERRRNRARLDQWLGRFMGGLLAVKLLFAAVFVLVVLLGLLSGW